MFNTSLVPRLSCMAEKKGSATHVQCAHGFLKFGNFRKTSGRHANVSPVRDAWHRPCSVWTMTARGAMKTVSSSLEKIIMHLSGTAKCYSIRLTQSFLKFTTNRLERSNTDGYCQSNVVSDFETTQRCLTGLRTGFNCENLIIANSKFF